jgi:hypothetical protein
MDSLGLCDREAPETFMLFGLSLDLVLQYLSDTYN